MCGITGFIDFKRNTTMRSLRQMTDVMLHRGPDGSGYEIIAVALGMRRLSIIDLSNGEQPMYADDKNVVIVFNGEIYNYKSLKANLIAQNVTFKTNSDTEVILWN